MIGTLDEAQEIFELNERAWRNAEHLQLPEGWTFVGSGGTRRVYRSPSGVAYKVNYYHAEDEPTPNDLEHNNFRRIAREGKLPGNWKVPRSHVYRFRANLSRYTWEAGVIEKSDCPTEVAVLACDYIDGKLVGGLTHEDSDYQHAEVVFAKIGLCDLGGKNVVKTPEHYYIVDAAEDMVAETKDRK